MNRNTTNSKHQMSYFSALNVSGKRLWCRLLERAQSTLAPVRCCLCVRFLICSSAVLSNISHAIINNKTISWRISVWLYELCPFIYLSQSRDAYIAHMVFIGKIKRRARMYLSFYIIFQFFFCLLLYAYKSDHRCNSKYIICFVCQTVYIHIKAIKTMNMPTSSGWR